MSLLSPDSESDASDQSRYRKPGTLSIKAACGLGALGGVCYGVTEWYLDHYASGVPNALLLTHDLFDWIIPVMLGTLAGGILSLYRRQIYLNRNLSIQNTHLKSKVLANTLIAHILHEIKNPIHNLSAALDQSEATGSENSVIRRNLHRLNETISELRQVAWTGDGIEAAQPTDFSRWIQDYLAHSVQNELRSKGLRLEKSIEPMILFMHPLLLEQCFTVLFENALRALKGAGSARKITLTAKSESDRHGMGLVEIRNSGQLFPAQVIEKSGKVLVAGSEGMGIGLVLVHDTLDQIGGALRIFNSGDEAVVQMLIPREARP